MHDIGPVKHGNCNPEFVGHLLHFLMRRVEVPVNYDFEKMIRIINSDTQTTDNKQLER
jgi:hypothetical protein